MFLHLRQEFYKKTPPYWKKIKKFLFHNISCNKCFKDFCGWSSIVFVKTMNTIYHQRNYYLVIYQLLINNIVDDIRSKQTSDDFIQTKWKQGISDEWSIPTVAFNETTLMFYHARSLKLSTRNYNKHAHLFVVCYSYIV